MAKSKKQKTKVDIKTLVTDTALALDEFAASAESSSELLTGMGLSRKQALDAADLDEEVESCREDLRTAMTSSSWRVWGDNTDETQIDRLYRIIRRHLTEFAELVLTAKLGGYAVAEYVYKQEADGFLTLDKVINKSSELDNYTPKRDGSLLFRSPRGEEVIDTTIKHLLLTSRATSANPAGEPAVARLFPAVMLRRHGIKYALQFIKRYAQPYIVGKTDGDKAEFNRSLYAFNAGGAATVGTEDAIDILKLDADGSAFKRIEQLANARIQKMLLGRVKTADLDSGSRAAQEIEEKTRGDRIDAYLGLLSRAVQHALDALIAVNEYYGRAIAAPNGLWFEFEEEIKVDKERAERDKSYLETGTVRLTKDYYVKILGFEPEHIELVEPTQAIPARHEFALSSPHPALRTTFSQGEKELYPLAPAADDDAVTQAIEQALLAPKINVIMQALAEATSYADFLKRLEGVDLSVGDKAVIDRLVSDDVRALADGLSVKDGGEHA